MLFILHTKTQIGSRPKHMRNLICVNSLVHIKQWCLSVSENRFSEIFSQGFPAKTFKHWISVNLTILVHAWKTKETDNLCNKYDFHPVDEIKFHIIGFTRWQTISVSDYWRLKISSPKKLKTETPYPKPSARKAPLKPASVTRCFSEATSCTWFKHRDASAILRRNHKSTSPASWAFSILWVSPLTKMLTKRTHPKR